MQQMERVDKNPTYNRTLYPAVSYGFEVNWKYIGTSFHMASSHFSILLVFIPYILFTVNILLKRINNNPKVRQQRTVVSLVVQVKINIIKY